MLKRRKFSESERLFMLQRAKGCCEYCLTRYDFSCETFEIEHIIPLINNGTNELSNLAFSCGGCNNRKGQKVSAIDPLSGTISPLYNPRIDKWHDHFVWQEDYARIEGISIKGSATVEQLKLNRIGLINLRRALFIVGVHPPEF